MRYPAVASFKTQDDFKTYLKHLNINLAFDEQLLVGSDNPLGKPYFLKNKRMIGNRFAILPMEGWDGTLDGLPTANTFRRWKRFGQSGAKLIWGGEAVAVSHAGRANPNQLMINKDNLRSLAKLRNELVGTHQQLYETTDDLIVGLQLTHSGRFARPNSNTKAEPKILYTHPILDKKFAVDVKSALLNDSEIKTIIEDFVKAARFAHAAGFHFVDIKHCHGYLGHEFLSAVHRPGPYGGSFDNRTRFLKEIVAGIRSEVPELEIAVRLSAFDWQPFKTGKNGSGAQTLAEDELYDYAFGSDKKGTGIRLNETIRFLKLLEDLEIELICITAGSPYYNPHIQRPALFPPSDGYLPPEDPLAGVARQINVTARLKQKFPNLALVGSAYSYLQEFLPHVAQNVVRTNKADFVGIGRMALAYPEFPIDVLNGKPLQRKRICRTFSDCTTAPRSGLPSGCYPLDEYYSTMPEAEKLKAIKKAGLK